MLRSHNHPALAFHSWDELPLIARHAVAIRPDRFDRCYIWSASKSSTESSPQQNTLSTSGAASPTVNVSGRSAKSISTTDAPVYEVSGSKNSVTSGAPIFNVADKSNLTLETTDQGAVAGGLTIAQDALATTQSFFDKLVDQNKDMVAGSTALLGTALQSNSDLAGQVQSGGQTETNAALIKLALIVAGCIAAVFGFIMLKKKS
jgi:hypothetical protein